MEGRVSCHAVLSLVARRAKWEVSLRRGGDHRQNFRVHDPLKIIMSQNSTSGGNFHSDFPAVTFFATTLFPRSPELLKLQGRKSEISYFFGISFSNLSFSSCESEDFSIQFLALSGSLPAQSVTILFNDWFVFFPSGNFIAHPDAATGSFSAQQEATIPNTCLLCSPVMRRAHSIAPSLS